MPLSRSLVGRSSSRALLGVILVAALVSSAGRPAQARAEAPWPLGTLQLTNDPVFDCPSGFTCNKFQVLDCPNVQYDDRGEIAQSDPPGASRGVVIFFDGGGGHEWWADPGPGSDFLAHLRDDDHFTIVEVRWVVSWINAQSGERTGPAHLACRGATAIQWIHDNIYLPLGLSPWPGQCGFCITGNSGGASEVAYPLSFYGLDSILDADIPTGGPDHAAITKGCLEVGDYAYNLPHRDNLDISWGFLDPATNPGPCNLEDPSWTPIWDAAAVDIGGNDYDHPATRVELIEGGLDDTGAPAHGADYRDRLQQDPSNHVTWTFIPDMPHHISDNPEGQAAIEASLLKAIGAVTTIDSGPSDPTNETSAAFTFSADDPAATFACSLDGAPKAPCSSPATYDGLPEGPHSFTVQGTDANGRAGPPATWTWTIDSGPITTILSGPPDPTNQTSATFSFIANDPTATFTCSLDGEVMLPCASPVNYDGLAEGAHEFAVRATTSERGTGLPASWTWTVDTTPPALVAGGLQMFDADADGRIDHVNATFSEPLNPYEAGNAPWTLSSVPSGGTLSSVEGSRRMATLTVTEGPGPQDTSVGAFTVALAPAANGIRDAAGNLGSFGPTAPIDEAGPVPVNVRDTNGTIDGRIESGDTLVIRFSEALSPDSLPARTTVSEADPLGAGTDSLTISRISTEAVSTGSDAYVTTDGARFQYPNSLLRLSNGNAVLTVRVGLSCTGQCGAAASGGPGTLVFAPTNTITDGVGNGAGGRFSVPNLRLF